MRSNGLALLLVAAGSALLGSSAAGVSALAQDLPAAPAAQSAPCPHVDQHHRALRGERGL